MRDITSVCFLCQAEDGIRYLVRYRGLGDVYKRQEMMVLQRRGESKALSPRLVVLRTGRQTGQTGLGTCLLYTSDAADERSSVDLGGRRIIKKKTRGEPRRHKHTSENTE